MTLQLDWRGDDILAALPGPFRETNEIYQRRAQQAITENRWQWPVQPSPRDIVDQGGLRDSYRGFPVPPFSYDHAWGGEDVAYALAVHEGARLQEGNQPARPWAITALDEFDFAGTFARLVRARLR